jgi:hypothetical protein
MTIQSFSKAFISQTIDKILETFTVIFLSGMQHGIKPFLEFPPNDRQVFRASAKYSQISFVQNKLRLNSGNSVETGKIHGFTSLIFICPNFVP